MYARLHSAIREYDDQHIIFFEPTVAITSVRIHTVHSECLYLVCVCVSVWAVAVQILEDWINYGTRWTRL